MFIPAKWILPFLLFPETKGGRLILKGLLLGIIENPAILNFGGAR
jgi:hypothetical protein